jgi:hypothetical protein
MKRIICITLILFVGALRSHAQIDTLKWLRNNIEAQRPFFIGKPLKYILDSLKEFKFAISDYLPPDDEGGQEPDTIYTKHLTFYFKPGWLAVEHLHSNSFFSHPQRKDTLHTHVPFIRIYFSKRVPFLNAWRSSDKEGLGSVRWNEALASYWGKFIVEKFYVAEY